MSIEDLPAEGRVTWSVAIAGFVAAVIVWATVVHLSYSVFTTKPNLSVQQGDKTVMLFWSALSLRKELCWEIRKNSEIFPIGKIEGDHVEGSVCPPDRTQEQAAHRQNTTENDGQDWQVNEWKYAVRKLMNDRTYAFSVRAKSKSGQYGPWSNVVNTSPSATTHLLSSIDGHVTKISQITQPNIVSRTASIATALGPIHDSLRVTEAATIMTAALASRLPMIASNTAAVVGPIKEIAARKHSHGHATSSVTAHLSSIENHLSDISKNTAVASSTTTIVHQTEGMAGHKHVRKSINVTFGRAGDRNETTVIYPTIREDAEDATNGKSDPTDGDGHPPVER